MRGLTLYQPWAADVAEGRKRYETRGHRTSYQGVLAIHAGVNRSFLPKTAEWLFMRPRAGAVLVPARPAFSLGAIVAVCWLERCVPSETIRASLGEQELDVGDWSDGRYGWELHDVRALQEPILLKGMQGLWPVDPMSVEQITEQVGLPKNW